MNWGRLLCLCVVKMRKKIKILTSSLCYQVGYCLIIAFPQRFSYRSGIYLCLIVFLLLFFFLKYKILKMFYFVFFSTKRVDHSNTRLASQLDRNPGNSPVCNEASQRICFMCLFLYTHPCMHTLSGFIASLPAYYKPF